ncbi:major facilitator superfamily domain-containing protein [Phialemonium atrogriseum]|uniref:Major facilitator superfamily domain-containing protein n=1 Tax=Phialemonium atrogriseum TaxID=1093897 RepID=A0AAJ0FFH7_9PEZI|nr:major facilitator superfamily domain-containing protein [Phialemonium atrogriseum]KAK1766601.1 major facilitator superfamily domain-containing protein [Phialemonium atrogriseum]
MSEEIKEKNEYDVTPPELAGSSTSSVLPEWDPKDELKARRKIDSSVLPLLFLGLLVFQLDRMNLASALTGGFAKDIKVSQDTINLGNQLMFMGIVIWEIPCNMALQRLGPRKWISAQVFVFGLIATLQVFVKNRTGFLIARLALGFAEAGYIPGAVYTLSTWYTRTELAKRVAIFFFGMFGGNAISPLLASGILKLDNARGIRGWQWLFLIEGLFTITVSLVLALFLPGSPDLPRPLLSPGIIRVSEAQRVILQKRLEKSDSERRDGAQGMHIPLEIVWKTVSHYRRWPHFVSTFAVFSCWSPLTTYTPSIMVSLGFDRIVANALAAVGASLALVVVFMFAYLSDKTNRRGGTVIAAQVCFLITLIVAHEAQPHVGKWSRWGLWTAVNAFAVGYHPVHNSWVQLNCRDPRERSISIAMWVMSAISGLMVGTQYYQGGDSPLYTKGLRTQIIMVSVGIVFAALQIVVYVVHNRRVAQGKHQEKDGSESMIYVP